jgi:hypothetical protein
MDPSKLVSSCSRVLLSPESSGAASTHAGSVTQHFQQNSQLVTLPRRWLYLAGDQPLRPAGCDGPGLRPEPGHFRLTFGTRLDPQ